MQLFNHVINSVPIQLNCCVYFTVFLKIDI